MFFYICPLVHWAAKCKEKKMFCTKAKGSVKGKTVEVHSFKKLEKLVKIGFLDRICLQQVDSTSKNFDLSLFSVIQLNYKQKLL